jgi:hypothetical protein
MHQQNTTILPQGQVDMSKKDLLEGGLTSLKVTIDLPNVERLASNLRETELAANSYKYVDKETIANGFKTITNSVTDVVSQVEGSVPSQVAFSLGVVQLDKTASKKELVKVVSTSDKTDLKAITGKDELSQNGFLDVSISAPFPEAIAEVVQTTTNLKPTEIKGIVNNNIRTEIFTDGVLDTVIGDVIRSSNSLTNALKNSVGTINRDKDLALNKIALGFNSLLENLVEATFQSAGVTLAAVSSKGDVVYNVPEKDVKRIIELKRQGKLDEAVVILQQYSDRDIATLKATILKIDNRAATALEPTPLSIDIQTKRTDNYTNLWREATTDITSKIFDSVIRPIEIETEIANLRREVTEIVIFAMGSRSGKSVNIEEWHNQYVRKYEKGFNPHFYINKKGVLYRGRPLEVKALNHSFGGYPDHSERSIFILLEGHGAPISDDTMNELRRTLEHIYRVKPGIQVFGINDIIPSNESPYFNVPRYIRNTLGKNNISEYNPRVKAPLTQKQLIEYRG